MAQGIDRIKQLFEVRSPKTPAIIAPFDWTVSFREEGKMRFMILHSDYQKTNYLFKDWYSCIVKQWDMLAKWWVYALKWKSKMKIKEWGMVIEIGKDHIVVWSKQTIEYSLIGLNPLVSTEGEQIYKWQILTNSALDIRNYQSIVGDLEAMKYMLREVNRVYWAQGQAINDKHIEVIIKQIFSKVFIYDTGDSSFIPGTHAKLIKSLSLLERNLVSILDFFLD